MKEIQILGLLLLIVILILFFVKISQEGFAYADDKKVHDDFSKEQQQKYNNVAAILAATTTNGTSNVGALGTETGGMMGSIQDTLDSSGKPVQYIDNPYPLEAKPSGMAAIIEKCEAVKSTDCSAFDNSGYSDFSTNCGICLDVGTNSQDKPHTGALVLTSLDKQYAQTKRKGNFLAPYNPTVGTCPSGKMVATKAECLRLTAELACQRSASMDTTTGCSQCYTDGVYHIVPPSDTSLKVGSGILKVIGSGTLSWTEHFGTNANTGTATLSPSVFITIPLSGPEYTKITLNVASRPIPRLYDPSVTYRVNDLIIFTLNGTKGIFKMKEATGQAGYDPSNPVSGSKTWTLLTPFSTYDPPPSTFIAGYLESPNDIGFQPIDLYRVVMTDTVAGIGRKPRTIDQTSLNTINMTKMGPAYGKTAMSLSIYSPFTFIDSLSQEASLCPSSPFITKADSASFLNSDPCYVKGSGPGNYSLECLQQIFQNNGCGTSPGTLDKSGFPATNAKASGLMMDKNGKNLTIKEIADKIYQYAIASATGVDSTGKKLSISDWSDASMFCNGVAINSACDVLGDDGKLTDDCIVYLWDNQGENKIPGPTYSMTSLARSLFATGITNRFCTRNGSLSPKDNLDKPKLTNNVSNLTYWKNIGDGSVAAVKAAMTQLHLDANSTITNEAAKTNFIKQCYGIVPNDRNIYSGTFTSDTSVQGQRPVLPSINPVSGVSGIVAWFDAADPFNSGETLVNGMNVTTWANKFGNRYDAMSKGTSNPIIMNSLNNLPGITISPGNYFRSPIVPGTFISALNVFVVYKTTGSSSGPGQIITRGLSSVPNMSNPLDMANNPNAAFAKNEMYIGERNQLYYQSGNNYNFNNPTTSIFNLNLNQSSQATSNLRMFSNGSQITLNLSRGGSATWTPTDLGDMFCIGGRIDYGNVDGVFYEVLVYTNTLSDVERQKVEGYLATKWGLQSSLPAGHPYKSTAFTPMPVRPVSTVPISPVLTGAGWSL
jgi:hypothetical protein